MEKEKFEALLKVYYPNFIKATETDAADAREAVLNLVTDALHYAIIEGLDEPTAICSYAIETAKEEASDG